MAWAVTAAYGRFSADVERSLPTTAILSLELHELGYEAARCGKAREVALQVFGPRHDVIAHCLKRSGRPRRRKGEWKEAATLHAETGLRFRNEIEKCSGGKQIQLEDPDGNPIEFFKPAQHSRGPVQPLR